MNSFVMLRRSKWDTQEKSVYQISHSGVMLSERAACVCVCVCVCVICTFRGGSLCSVGLDASFGSGLLWPLCDVVSLPCAESEPLYFAG